VNLVLSRLTVNGRFNYRRHFALLSSVAVLLAVAHRWQAPPSAASEFALYGALHAATLVLCLRSSPSIARQILFVAAAAVLALAVVRCAFFGMRFVAGLPGATGPLALLMAVSGAGALAYFWTVRIWWGFRAARGASWRLPLMCAFAAAAAFIVANRFHALSGLWLAIPWWVAFSAALCHYDERGGVVQAPC
jgi:hypothetical protein